MFHLSVIYAALFLKDKNLTLIKKEVKKLAKKILMDLKQLCLSLSWVIVSTSLFASAHYLPGG